MKGLRTKLAAAVGSAALAFTPAAFANDDARPATTYTSEKKAPAAKTAPDLEAGITFVDDADIDANKYVANDPDKVAFSFRCGGAMTIPLIRVEKKYKEWASDNNLDNALFFWEHGGQEEQCTVKFHSDYKVTPPMHIVNGEEAMARFAEDLASIKETENQLVLALR